MIDSDKMDTTRPIVNPGKNLSSTGRISERKLLKGMLGELVKHDSLDASRDIYRYLDKAINALKLEPAVFDVEAKKAIIIGDLHGDTETFRKIMKAYPIEEYTYILVGDYVDRGKNGTELLAMLVANKILHRKNFIMLRGDHEGPMYSILPQEFPDEMARKLKDPLLLHRIYNELFPELPIAVVLNKKYFVVHGGIPIDAPSISDLKKLQKVADPEDNKEILQMMWNDPSPTKDTQISPRSRSGEVHLFGSEVSDSFLGKNGLDMVIRGHEHGPHSIDGMDKRVLTVLTTTAYPTDKPYIAKIEEGKLDLVDMSGPVPKQI